MLFKRCMEKSLDSLTWEKKSCFITYILGPLSLPVTATAFNTQLITDFF